MFIGGGVVAAVVLVIGFRNYPPQPKDSTGAIGAAQRYHEPQITSADVKVSQDELTAWLQSDTFDRIVKDPEARRLFANEAVQRVLADDANKRISDGANKQFSDAANKQLSDDARKQLSDGANKQLSDAANKQLVDGANRQFSISDSLRKELSAGDFAMVQAALANGAIRDAMSSEAFLKAMANDALRNGLVSEARKLDGVGKVD
jgi:hypothetical protein